MMTNGKSSLFIKRDGSVRMELRAYPNGWPEAYIQIAEPCGQVGDAFDPSAIQAIKRTYRLVQDCRLMYVFEEL